MNGYTLGESVFLGITPSLAAVIVTAFYIALRRANVRHCLTHASLTAFVIALWLLAVCVLSTSGWLSVWEALPPRVPLLVFIALVAYLGLTRAQIVKSSLTAFPLWLPVLIQSFRIAVEFALWQMHREGSVPIQFTFEGRNFDMLVGITAPFVALGIAMRWIGPKTTVAWNLLGIALLINAVFTAATSSPGPQHLNWPGEPFTAIASWPLVWLPTFLAPTAVFLHLVSLMQNAEAIGQRRTGSERLKI